MKLPAHLLPAAVSACLLFASGVVQADVYRTVDLKTGAVTYTNIPRQAGVRYQLVLRDNSVSEPARSVPKGVSTGAGSRGAPLTYNWAEKSKLFSNHIAAAAKANNLEPALIRAVISAESAFNPFAESTAGAVGLMQLMPGTAQRYGVANRRDPAQSIHGGARYLRDLLQMFNNNLPLALAAYNAGEHAVVRYGNRIPPYAETINYVPRVLRYYYQFRTPA